MGTHPIFESDFDCLTEMKTSFLGLIGFVISQESHLCGDTTLLSPWCTAANGKIEKLKKASNVTACKAQESVIGISYAYCNMSEIPTTDIISNRNVSYIDFRQTNCPYNSNKTSIGDLYDAEQLETLVVSKSCEKCPGAFDVANFSSNQTETFEPWGASDFGNEYGLCTDPTLFCNYNQTNTPFNGYSCPKDSQCTDKGVGTFDCQCNEGYHGYKCMNKGTFPFAIVLTVTPTISILLTGGLWYIGRRNVVKID